MDIKDNNRPASNTKDTGQEQMSSTSPSQGNELLKYRPEDGGILDCWVERYGSERIYVYEPGDWFEWTGRHWCQTQPPLVRREIQDLLGEMNSEAHRLLESNQTGSDLYKAYVSATKRSQARVSSIEGMARTETAVSIADLDQGDFLNLENGTLNLDTCRLKAHDASDLLTYCLPYEFDQDADCPRWMRFIEEVIVDEEGTPDPDLASLFQELAGYSLTDDTRYQVMIWLWGNGANGKSVAIDTLQQLVGPLTTTVDFHFLGQQGNYDLAKLPGKRLIVSTESNPGGTIAEGLIKRIASGETVSARAIYGHPFEFPSVGKIWWAMNDKPLIRDSSDALWRRLILIPFNRSFRREEQDVDLTQKLQQELSGILNWCLEGLKRLQENGSFTKASAERWAVEEFRRETNPVASWRAMRTQPQSDNWTQASKLFRDYRVWANHNGTDPLNATAFGRMLTNLPGVEKKIGRHVLYNLILSCEQR